MHVGVTSLDLLGFFIIVMCHDCFFTFLCMWILIFSESLFSLSVLVLMPFCSTVINALGQFIESLLRTLFFEHALTCLTSLMLNEVELMHLLLV